jgi:LysR family transcriptional regulator, regulator for metE and metH
MYNINIQHLKVIRAIEMEGTMTRAAASLHVTQSALSHCLRELEKNIGMRVFDRRNKKLWVTEAGRKMLAGSEVIMAELNKLENEMTSLKVGESGTIRISTECYTTYTWLPKIIRGFKKKHPKVQVKIVAEATRRPLQYLKEGKLDIGIINNRHEKYPFFDYFPLFKDELVVVLNKENPLAGRKGIYAKDLKEQVIIVYDTDDKENDLLQYVLNPNNIQPADIIKIQLTEAIIEMVKSNLGISVMAKWLIEPLINKDLVLLPFKDQFASRNWQLVTYRDPNPLQRVFIKFITNGLNKR